MGREIRRVPPNWEHPRHTRETAKDFRNIGQYIPMHDQSYQEASKQWVDGFLLWNHGKHPEQIKYPDESWVKGVDFWEYDSPPDRDSYRPEFTVEPTWYQVYETVSEGTPDSPPFATEGELIEYLCTYGSLHHKEYPDICPILTRRQAEAFVDQGSAVSMVINNGVMKTGMQACEDFVK